jgi:hypothetical protein
MRTVRKSKTSPLSPKKEFFVKNQRAVVTNNIGSAGARPGKTKMDMASEIPALAEVTNEERHHLIAEAAYYHAAQRNFSPGAELEDWLNAEAEIELRLSKAGTKSFPKNA